MAEKSARAVIQREADGGYSLGLFQTLENEDEQLLTTTPDMTLSAAFDAAKAALAPMAVDPEKHQKITIGTRIK